MSYLGLETKATYNSRKGRKPEADYKMTGFVEGDALYVVPVAAKKTISKKNIAQITQYMANLCKGRYVRRLCTVGLLLDQSNVRLCFSALALESGNNNIPLPITVVSPVLQWRLGIILNEPVCTAMALFNNFRHKRRVVNEVEWATFFEGEVWKEIKKVAFEAAEKDYVLTRPEDKDVIRPWLHQLRRNTEELEEVRRQSLD